MNPDYLKKASEKVGNTSVLINLISRRVRQLNYHNGPSSRSLVLGTGHLGVADIALREIIEEKMGWEVPEIVPLIRPASRKYKKQGTVAVV
jgi:DNA-directed RNA polymerase subunit K/omega